MCHYARKKGSRARVEQWAEAEDPEAELPHCSQRDGGPRRAGESPVPWSTTVSGKRSLCTTSTLLEPIAPGNFESRIRVRRVSVFFNAAAAFVTVITAQATAPSKRRDYAR